MAGPSPGAISDSRCVHHATRRKRHHRLALRGRVRRDRLAQPPAGLAGRHHDEDVGEVERRPTLPTAREKGHRLRQERLRPRQKMTADVGRRGNHGSRIHRQAQNDLKSYLPRDAGISN